MPGNNLTSTNTALHGNMFSIYKTYSNNNSGGGSFGKYQDSSSYTNLKKIHAIKENVQNNTNYSGGGNVNTINSHLRRTRSLGTITPKKFNK